MDYSHISFLLGTLILIIVFYVLLSPVKEEFQSTAEQPIGVFNTCGRNIAFLKSGMNLASSRAVFLDNANLKNVGNNIPLSKDNSHVDHATYSIVKDNYIYYTFRKLALDLHYSEVSVAGSKASFKFTPKNETLAEAITYFVLCKPIYVEFHNSIAYHPIFSNDHAMSTIGQVFRYTNYDMHLKPRGNSLQTHKQQLVLGFEPVFPKHEMRNAGVFNYGNDAFTIEDLKLQRNNSQTKMTCYFLDDNIPLSLQNVGKTMSRDGYANLFEDNSANAKNEIIIFNKDFARIYQNNSDFKEQAIYEFNNNINVFFRNFVVPTFSFCFDIEPFAVRNDTNTMAVTVYMDNNYGNYSVCQNVVGMPKNNNIMSLIIESGNKEHNAVNLVLTTGRGQNNCNYPFSDNSGVAVTVPRLVEKKLLRVIVTVSPNEKIIAAFWSEPERTSQKFVAFASSKHCANDLNLWKLFKEGENSGRERTINIANIVMARNAAVLKSCKYVKLGFVNIMNEYLHNA
jgi:hypothetical protein